MRKVKVFFVVVAAVLSVSAWSKDYHVSPRGKSLEKALKSISKEKSDVRLILSGGDYFISGPVIFKDLKGVTIEAAPGQEPVLRGDRIIKGFKPWKDGILRASLKSLGIKDMGEACVKADLVDLYWKGERQRIAAYPDEGFLISGEALGQTVVDDVTRKEGIFKYKEEVIDSWADEKDAWIYGYFRWEWKDDYGKVASIDPQARTISIAEPWHYYGYKDGFKFKGVNILKGLDSPGEYYIDREAGVLYWYPPVDYAPGDEVTISVFSSEFMLEVSGCEGVAVQGLTFIGGRTNAVSVEGSRNILLDGIGAFRFGGDALHVSSSENVRIEGCRFGTLGHTGMKLSGGDRRTLSPSGYVVRNTIVQDISLFRHTYEPALIFSGCGLNVSHCEFSGSFSSAMRFEGNDIVVEYCHFHDLVQESDDQGAIDIFYNYGYRGNVIRYNLLENIRGGSLHGSAGVRFDDMISGQKVYGNIFRNVGGGHFGGVQIHGGKDNVVENNLFYNCNIGVSFSPWGQAHWDEALTREEVVKRLYEEVDIDSPLYRERYPELAGDIHSNVDRNIIRNNLMVGCGRMFYDEKGQNSIINNSALSTGEDAELSKPLEYYLSPEVLASFGLKPIPYKEIGPEGSRLF